MAFWPKTISDPWFTHLLTGKKLYDCGINHNEWQKMNIGDTIHYSRNGSPIYASLAHINSVELMIVEKWFITSFLTVSEEWGEELLPGVSAEHRITVYQGTYNSDKDRQDVANYGIIVIKLMKM